MLGQLTIMPTGALSVMSSQVQPSSSRAAAVPLMTPPPGIVTATVMPLARVTGMISLSGLTPASARMLGLMLPVSTASLVARTEPISFRPVEDVARTSPG